MLAGDKAVMARFTIKDLETIVFATHTGMSVKAFADIVKDWFAKAKHPRWNRPYTELVYQPMLALRDLRANGYDYICPRAAPSSGIDKRSSTARGSALETPAPLIAIAPAPQWSSKQWPGSIGASDTPDPDRNRRECGVGGRRRSADAGYAAPRLDQLGTSWAMGEY